MLSSKIKTAFQDLLLNDGCLFESEQGIESDQHSRKLHEVCINHKLANYLEKYVLPIFKNEHDEVYVDIEFNREGGNQKEWSNGGLVRPDIIIHNRKSGESKKNILIVECKKAIFNNEFTDDIDKIEAFMEDDKYLYQYGLQVIYDRDRVKGKLFYNRENVIKESVIIYP